MPAPSNIVRRIITLAVCIALAGSLSAAATFVTIDMMDKRPASIIKAALDANSITYRDGRLQLYFDVTRLRECPTTTTRWLWTWVTYKDQQVRLFMPLGVSFTGVTDIGEESYLLSLEVPKDVWDGTWYYYAREVTRCGGLMSLLRDQVSEIPSIPITIGGRTSPPPPNIKPAKPPTGNVPLWRKAIIMDGQPLP